MKIYISGISGTGMGPLALMARQAGYEVCGSDLEAGAIYPELVAAGIEIKIGLQDGVFLQQKIAEGVDWFVHTSALPQFHAELNVAQAAGIKISKRDELTAELIKQLGLKMIAVAGTHGKTTTTAMIVYAAQQLGLPVSYVVGTTLGFAPSGAYHEGDKYFAYEADEYDYNFLHFHPWLAVLTYVSYDHPDIYPTREAYRRAFAQFAEQSENVLERTTVSNGMFRLAGAVRRHDAALAAEVIRRINPDIPEWQVVEVLNGFPGVGRRFEKIADGFYSDYAHHPEEIEATVEIAKEEAVRQGKKGIVVVYQPHQNTRQHELRHEYKNVFKGASKVFWLPTYLTREDKSLNVLSQQDLINELALPMGLAVPAEADDLLYAELYKYYSEGYLILLMTAGPADKWLRDNVYRKPEEGSTERLTEGWPYQ